MTMKLYEKPNVKEFKTPFGYYFYDASRNEIIKVREELFWGIHNAMQNDFWHFEEKKIFDEYSELFDCGYFHTLQIDKLEHPETNNISVYLEKKIDGIILQITQQCNLRCNYCVYSENSYNSQRPHY